MVENGNSRPNGTPNIEKRIDNGRVFSAREVDSTGIGDGGTFSVVIQNPADSGVNLLTIAPQVSTTGEAFFEKIENPTIDTAGDTVAIRNKKVGYQRSPHATAEAGGTNFTGAFSGGTSRGRQVVGGQSAKQAGSIGAADLSLRLNPGESVQYKVESNSSSNIVSVNVAFVEEPTTA
jgi:hypothetical protein